MKWEDSMMVIRGDTTRPASTAMRRVLADLRAKQVRDFEPVTPRWRSGTAWSARCRHYSLPAAPP
jgi:hypothetical protein